MRTIPDSGTTGISETEWLVELEALNRKDGKGQTPEEMAESSGMSAKKVRVLLQRAMNLGRLVREERTRERIDGKAFQQTVYRITGTAAKKAARKKGR